MLVGVRVTKRGSGSWSSLITRGGGPVGTDDHDRLMALVRQLLWRLDRRAVDSVDNGSWTCHMIAQRDVLFD